MAPSVIIVLFAIIVFAPCLLALAVSERPESFPEAIFSEKWRQLRVHSGNPAPLQGMLAELPISEDFEIRSFPKGLSQRRLVVRDTESGVKLTIAQVREAAAELIKLGGAAAAYKYALIAAATAVAMGAVKDAFKLAAEEALTAARHAYAWVAWGEVLTQDHIETMLWSETPPKIPSKPVRLRDSGSWRKAVQAA